MAAALVVTACAGPKAELRHGTFRAPARFRVTLPASGWTVTKAGASELELQHPATRAGILANTDCGPAIAGQELPALARRLFLGLQERTILANGAVTLAGHPAIHAVLEARVKGQADPMRVEAYVMKDERCVYDLVYVAPLPAFAEGRPDFQRLVDSFVKE